MAYEDSKSSAQLQREVEEQREQLENRIDSISEKLSPGQLVDELLAYAKGGGGEYVSSLKRNITANPLPVALLGVSLAWLMAKPAPSADASDRQWDDSINVRRGYGDHDDYDTDYPVAIISGSSLRRVSRGSDDKGANLSHFVDDAGKKYRAATDAAGRRAGHFVDETGARFKGFSDAGGKQIEHFRDEAGNMLDDVSNWASHTWQKAREKMHDARDSVGHGAHGAQARMGQAGQALGGQMGSLNQTIMTQFRDQPLVAGALAFAAGAAFGSALPHTEQEDAVLGEAADAVKAEAAHQAEDLYEQGREKATELYEQAAERVSEAYQGTREEIASAVDTSTPKPTSSY